jgi:small ligand-binding sensory domain FIST
MTAMTPHAVSHLLAGTYSEAEIITVAQKLRTQLGGNAALGFVFATPEWRDHLEDTLELIRLHARVPRLVGCSGSGIIGTKTELERRPGLSILLLSIPENSFQIFTISESDLEGGSDPEFWREFTGLKPNDVNGWIVLANPAFREIEKWLEGWNSSFPGKPIVGGLATASESEDFLFRDGEVISAPIIAVALSSPIAIQVLMSQGCRPIGDPSPITKAEDNFILEIGNVPAYQTLEAAFLTVPAEERNAVRNNLFLGLAASEYIDEFKRGDFLIRNILGADPQIGALAVGAYPRIGQTVQFQIRDSKSAHQDMVEGARNIAERGIRPWANLLFSCAGRGQGLFGISSHDAVTLAESLGASPLAGFFCNGEIGPIGSRSFLHGYSAAAAVLTTE